MMKSHCADAPQNFSPAVSGLSPDQWESFLSQHDLTWNTVGDAWEQGAFLGNGMMGAMIYGDAPNVLRWELGRSDVIERFQIPRVDWAPPRVLIGDFLLKTVGEIKSQEMRQHLWNAEATGVITTDRGVIRWRSLIHAEDMVLLIELDTEGDEDGASLSYRPQHSKSPCVHYDRIRAIPDAEWLDRHTPLEQKPCSEDGLNFSVHDFLGGGQYAVGWKEQVAGSIRRLYVNITTTFPYRTAIDDAKKQLGRSMGQEFQTWVDGHRQWWHEYYPKSFITLPDPYWESFYWIQMYKLASATREDGPIIDSQGPWMPQTPWPTCVWNLNVQVSYSPLMTSNRLELGESLYRRLDEDIDDLILNVPAPFRKDSAGIGRATSCVSLRCETSPGWETGNLTWVCYNYFRHCRCIMDDDMLRNRLYPLLRRAVSLYFHIAQEGEHGRIHLPGSVSPEYGESGPDQMTRDCNYDLALLQWGCRTLLWLTEKLGIEDEKKPAWEDMIARLVDPPVDEFGIRVGKDLGFRRSHRHFSHLFSIWPLRIRNVDHPELRELSDRSIDHWLSLDKMLQGYTWTSSSSMASSFGDGDLALERLQKLRPYLQPNTMYTELGPVIETPIMASESIHDMVLQSWADPLADRAEPNIIRVFPAVPSDWSDLTFHDFRAEGAFLVSACRRDGKTQWIRIESLAGEQCVVQTDIDGVPEIPGDAKLKPVGDRRWSVPVAKGEIVVLYPAGEKPDVTVAPLARDDSQKNLFGNASDLHAVHEGKPTG